MRNLPRYEPEADAAIVETTEGWPLHERYRLTVESDDQPTLEIAMRVLDGRPIPERVTPTRAAEAGGVTAGDVTRRNLSELYERIASDTRTIYWQGSDEGPTKNGKPRMVDLDGQTVAALRAWRATQARDRLAAGEAWQGGTPGEAGYVFTDELGEPYRPDVLTRAFGEAQSGLGLPRMVFHAMRHTSASILIAAGVAITVVSARLGHSQVSITLDVYSHLMPNDGAAAAAVIGRALYGETGT